MKKEKIVIIGSGPAGFTAALYTGRAALHPKVIVGHDLGGQISLTWTVENYPGFPEGLSGPELVEKMQKQAIRWGAELVMDVVKEVDFSKHPFVVKTTKEEYHAETVIVTTGATPRKLQIPGEKELTGKGVSYCATCDGPFFKGKEVIVVGGGDTALEEAIFLTKFSPKVYIVHRRDELRATSVVQKMANENDKIEFLLNTELKEIIGTEKVDKVKLFNNKTEKVEQRDIGGVFIFIGQIPNTDIFQGKLDMSKDGYIIVDEKKHTSIEGVFAAGECEDGYFKQIATAVGDGCRAGMEAQRYLANLSEIGEQKRTYVS